MRCSSFLLIQLFFYRDRNGEPVRLPLAFPDATATDTFRHALSLLDHNIKQLCLRYGVGTDLIRSFHLLPNLLHVIQAVAINLHQRQADPQLSEQLRLHSHQIGSVWAHHYGTIRHMPLSMTLNGHAGSMTASLDASLQQQQQQQQQHHHRTSSDSSIGGADPNVILAAPVDAQIDGHLRVTQHPPFSSANDNPRTAGASPARMPEASPFLPPVATATSVAMPPLPVAMSMTGSHSSAAVASATAPTAAGETTPAPNATTPSAKFDEPDSQQTTTDDDERDNDNDDQDWVHLF